VKQLRRQYSSAAFGDRLAAGLTMTPNVPAPFERPLMVSLANIATDPNEKGNAVGNQQRQPRRRRAH
jgi:hypothetical protein